MGQTLFLIHCQLLYSILLIWLKSLYLANKLLLLSLIQYMAIMMQFDISLLIYLSKVVLVHCFQEVTKSVFVQSK